MSDEHVTVRDLYVRIEPKRVVWLRKIGDMDWQLVSDDAPVAFGKAFSGQEWRCEDRWTSVEEAAHLWALYQGVK